MKINEGDLVVLTGNEINEILLGREGEIIEAVAEAYKCHGRNEDFLPHSIFLRFPDSEKNRIIGLPAYLGGSFQKSGMKWIASYPGNHEKGLDRASASIILNSVETGIPIALFEGSVISAKRTAASAALTAAQVVTDQQIEKLSQIGCGLINFETLRFLRHVFGAIRQVFVYDIQPENALIYKRKCEKSFDGLEVVILDDVPSAFRDFSLVCLATTAVKPHISDPSLLKKGSTILHTSLRDFTPQVIFSSVNIVDDIDHVSRAQTSIHLARQQNGQHNFIRGTLPQILLGEIEGRENEEEVIISSPFGLGILDIAVSDLIYKLVSNKSKGTVIPSFLPDYWLDRN
ncbi:2,3-diaminopropionate biosynthesis protein SbnB [Planktothrix sp. FACHB-1355]|uniref:2,3-diaminopropionate biosynthesis protein SbnB n=1 Tax=Planktothrix sp. FACHB-1355 TaxID=2692854 RepID=UPI00168C04B4|nr:2,3-diaminopropionate biosynthesis protein SbnB [Planktothrix sp. FACHB-1355]MBD3557350.1 2,3-diaminopropionate biosynthesis protein SbnB [Planktothrix sp. FACHB-1355]